MLSRSICRGRCGGRTGTENSRSSRQNAFSAMPDRGPAARYNGSSARFSSGSCDTLARLVFGFRALTTTRVRRGSGEARDGDEAHGSGLVMVILF